MFAAVREEIGYQCLTTRDKMLNMSGSSDTNFRFGVWELNNARRRRNSYNDNFLGIPTESSWRYGLRFPQEYSLHACISLNIGLTMHSCVLSHSLQAYIYRSVSIALTGSPDDPKIFTEVQTEYCLNLGNDSRTKNFKIFIENIGKILTIITGKYNYILPTIFLSYDIKFVWKF